ncbi:MAG: hypothetical protein ACLQM6_11105 [Acidobacteriaceae bacterium]
MFGKKANETKATLTDDQKSELGERLSIMLAVQMVVPANPVRVTKIEITKGHINRKAIGYIYGFIDCALQCRGEEITNLSVGLPILYHVLRSLFPGHEQAYVDFLMAHMNDEIVVLGMMEGGQQYNEFIHRSDAKGMPMGLSRFIFEGKE